MPPRKRRLNNLERSTSFIWMTLASRGHQRVMTLVFGWTGASRQYATSTSTARCLALQNKRPLVCEIIRGRRHGKMHIAWLRNVRPGQHVATFAQTDRDKIVVRQIYTCKSSARKDKIALKTRVSMEMDVTRSSFCHPLSNKWLWMRSCMRQEFSTIHFSFSFSNSRALTYTPKHTRSRVGNHERA